MTDSVFVRLVLSVALVATIWPNVRAIADMDVNVLEDHRVVYSSPKVQTKFQSAAK